MRFYKCDLCCKEILSREQVTLFEGYDVCKMCSRILDDYIRELTDRIREVILKNTSLVANKECTEVFARRIIAELGLPKHKKEVFVNEVFENEETRIQ